MQEVEDFDANVDKIRIQTKESLLFLMKKTRKS